MSRTLIFAGFVVSLLAAPLAPAMTVRCGAGDVPCLMQAMQTAKAQSQATRIILAAGPYMLTAVDHEEDGPTGLPAVVGTLTIQGAGIAQTVLQRDPASPPFRFFVVETAGQLCLQGLTVTGGFVIDTSGAGVLNFGTLQLRDTEFSHHVGQSQGTTVFGVAISNQLGHVQLWQSRLTQNRCDTDGVSTAGLFNEGGVVEISNSSIVENVELFAGAPLFNNVHTDTVRMTLIDSDISGNTGGIAGAVITNGTLMLHHVSLSNNQGRVSGALLNAGTLTIEHSAIAHNVAEPVALGDNAAGALFNEDIGVPLSVTITESTVGDNAVIPFDGAPRISGGILQTGGALTLTNVTLAGNSGRDAGGVYTLGTFSLENTILAENTGGNCRGSAVSGGNNLLDAVSCTITLQGTDLIGDPRLGDLTDNGTPGNGHFPLLPDSPAIDAGNDAACPKVDQLGQPRVGPCDIGAIEFQPPPM